MSGFFKTRKVHAQTVWDTNSKSMLFFSLVIAAIYEETLFEGGTVEWIAIEIRREDLYGKGEALVVWDFPPSPRVKWA